MKEALVASRRDWRLEGRRNGLGSSQENQPDQAGYAQDGPNRERHYRGAHHDPGETRSSGRPQPETG